MRKKKIGEPFDQEQFFKEVLEFANTKATKEEIEWIASELKEMIAILEKGKKKLALAS